MTVLQSCKYCCRGEENYLWLPVTQPQVPASHADCLQKEA